MHQLQTFLRRPRSRCLLLAFLLLFCFSFLMGCDSKTGGDSGSQDGSDKPRLVLVDVSWDSIKVHNRIVGYILQNGYGYPEPEYLFAETLPALQGMVKGNIDIYMEVWADNIEEAWEEALASGKVKNLGPNFPDAPQGWYVPTYMIEGDAERGIEATAPDLKKISDLPRYWELFKDPEVPSKGRFHNSPPGWSCTSINGIKIKSYGLDKNYNNFITGSDPALVASMVSAYEKGEPWFGYYWEPTWVMGKLKMTRLEEPDFDDAVWQDESNLACAYPSAQVLIGINSELEKRAPEVVEFLQNYETSLEQNNEFLAYMSDHNNDEKVAAVYFLQKYKDEWHSWVPADVAARVDQALEEVK